MPVRKMGNGYRTARRKVANSSAGASFLLARNVSSFHSHLRNFYKPDKATPFIRRQVETAHAAVLV